MKTTVCKQLLCVHFFHLVIYSTVLSAFPYFCNLFNIPSNVSHIACLTIYKLFWPVSVAVSRAPLHLLWLFLIQENYWKATFSNNYRLRKLVSVTLGSLLTVKLAADSQRSHDQLPAKALATTTAGNRNYLKF